MTLIIFVIIVSFLLFILVCPLKISLNFNIIESTIVSSGSLAIINSKFFYASFNSTSRKVDVLFLGKTLKKDSENIKEQKSDEDLLRKAEPYINETMITGEKKEDILSHNIDMREVTTSIPAEERFSKKEATNEDVKNKAEKKKDNRLKIIFSLFSNNKWRKKIFCWIKRVLFSLRKLVKFENFYLSICAGVEDPAIVGFLSGIHHLLRGITLINERNNQIEFFPVFMKNHFEFISTISVKTSLLRIILPFVLLFLTFPYIDTFFLWKKVSRRHS
ncbi:MAG: hypothetical protein N2053_07150 [Chitinispirillaceae bacterium]|nr:hypothetical protein [Chitinispirillaceae bacterium]